MEHNVKQVTMFKIHFPPYIRSFQSLFVSFEVVLILNFFKRENDFFLAEVVYFTVIVAERYTEHKRY